METALRQRLEALSPAARAELIHVLRLPDFDRADRSGEFWGAPGDADRVMQTVTIAAAIVGPVHYRLPPRRVPLNRGKQRRMRLTAHSARRSQHHLLTRR